MSVLVREPVRELLIHLTRGPLSPMANAFRAKDSLPGPSSASVAPSKRNLQLGQLPAKLLPARKRARVEKPKVSVPETPSSTITFVRDGTQYVLESEVPLCAELVSSALKGDFKPEAVKDAKETVRKKSTAGGKGSKKSPKVEKTPELTKRLLEVVHTGTLEEVISLAQRIPVNVQNELGNTPLHIATQYYRPDVARVLLDNGADTETRNLLGKSPLHIASAGGFVEIVEMLVADKAKVNACDFLRMTPLHWAVEKGHAEIVKLLLENGADMEQRNKFFVTSIDLVNTGSGRSRTSCRSKEKKASSPLSPTVNVVNDGKTETLELGRPLVLGKDIIFSSECILKPLSLQPVKEEPEVGVEDQVDAGLVQGYQEVESTVKTDGFNILKAHGIEFVSGNAGGDQNFISAALQQGHTISLTDVGREILKNTDDDDDDFQFSAWEFHPELAEVAAGMMPVQSQNPDLISSALQNGHSVSLTDVGKQLLEDVGKDDQDFPLFDYDFSFEESHVSTTVRDDEPLPSLTLEDVSRTLNPGGPHVNQFDQYPLPQKESAILPPAPDSSFAPEIIPAAKVKIFRHADGAEVQVENKRIKLPPTVNPSNLQVVRVPKHVLANAELLNEFKEQLMRQTARKTPSAKEA